MPELSASNPMYIEMALKFTEHFLWIASAMDAVGENEDEMWAVNGRRILTLLNEGKLRRVLHRMKMSAMITPQAALSTESAYAAIKMEPQQPTST
jgi:hypothetical protein